MLYFTRAILLGPNKERKAVILVVGFEKGMIQPPLISNLDFTPMNRFFRSCNLFLLFALFLCSGFTPLKWDVTRFDDRVSLTIPSTFRQSDTLGQRNFLATGQFGFLQAVKIPQPQAEIKNENELVNFYKAYQRIAIDQASGNLVSDTTLKLNDDLYIRTFTYEVVWNDSLEVQENMIIFIDHALYSFTYACFKEGKQAAKNERDQFFNGIKIYNSDFDDQLTIPNRHVRQGEIVGYVLRYIMIALLILAIVLWFFKKYLYVRLIKNIFSWTFLIWGAICLVIYLGNFFFGNPEFYFLIPGIACPIIGIALRWIKVPYTQNKTSPIQKN
jgi:hypothetical protein